MNPPAPAVVGQLVSRRPAAKIYEMAILVIWFCALFMPDVPGITLVRYLSVLYFLSFLVLDSQRVWLGVRKSWILIPIAIWAALSIFWTPYPTEAVRVAILALCSVFITIVIGSRYTPEQILICFAVTSILGTLYAALFIATANTGGPYASKNYLATHMSFAYIALLGLALRKETPVAFLPLLLAMAGLAGFIIYKADAVTSLLMIIASTLMLLAIKFVFVGLAGIRGARTLLFLTATSFVLLAALYFLNFVDPGVVDDFLALFGKDSSLTGRTDLWAAAKKVITDHPVTGVGLEGFWQYDVGVAQTLAENDHKAAGTKLGFHNAYLETGVHLGLVGIALFIISLIWATSILTVTFLRKPSMISGSFFTIMIVCLATSYTESTLGGSLNIPVTLFFGSTTAYLMWSEPRAVAKVAVRPSNSDLGRGI